jgi:hypothetical protein
MTSTEYRQACEALGVSVYGSAKLLYITPRTTQRYASGETPVPECIALLLRYMLRYGFIEGESQ